MLPPDNELLVIQRGLARLTTVTGHEELLLGGDHFGAKAISGSPPRGAMVHFLERSAAMHLPLGAIENLPIIRWKLIETHRRPYLQG